MHQASISSLVDEKKRANERAGKGHGRRFLSSCQPLRGDIAELVSLHTVAPTQKGSLPLNARNMIYYLFSIG
jgi:hypothetical protein